MDLVRLTIVLNEPAAEEIRAVLHTGGIESVQRKTDLGVAMTDASTSGFGTREILVRPDDLERAQELIADR